MNLKLIYFLLLLMSCLLAKTSLLNAAEKNKKVTQQDNFSVVVVDPFLELHTGPGINFPIYDIIERGEIISIIRRKTDWYQVKGSLNRIGWASREHMQETLLNIGIKKNTREFILEDFLRDKFRFDSAIGKFNDESSVTLRLAYRTNENIMLEFAIAHVSGIYSNSPLYQANILLELYTDLEFRPFTFMGYSRFLNVPLSATNLIATDLDMLNAGFGINYYMTDRFVIRLEFGDYIVVNGANRTDEFLNYSLGFSIFF